MINRISVLIIVIVLTHVAPLKGQETIGTIKICAEDKYEITSNKLTLKTNNETQKKKKVKYKKAWIKGSNVPVRKKPNKKSKIVKRLNYGDKIKYIKYNKKWAKIKIKKKYYYIKINTVKKKKPTYTVKDAPSWNGIKSYMDYRAITNTGSQQYKLQHSLAYTGIHGIRQVDGRYCIALGSYYTTTIGKYVDVILKNGAVIPCIIADCKADRDTDGMNRMHPDGSLVEFVVDTGCLESYARRMGDISYCSNWNSMVKKIKIYKKKARF